MCRHMYDWNIVNCDVKQPIHSLTRVGLIFADFATSLKSTKIDTAKNKAYYTSSLRVFEIEKIILSENLTHLPSVIFAKISRREKFPIYGIRITYYNARNNPNYRFTKDLRQTWVQWRFVNPETFVPGRYFRINEFSGLLNRPSVQKRKSVPTLSVRISEISGLPEPGLTNHHCIYKVDHRFSNIKSAEIKIHFWANVFAYSHQSYHTVNA